MSSIICLIFILGYNAKLSTVLVTRYIAFLFSTAVDKQFLTVPNYLHVPPITWPSKNLSKYLERGVVLVGPIDDTREIATHVNCRYT